MDFTGNISENWARWKELMELVLAGPSANKWTETQKAAQFLICIGQQGRDMARAWVSSGELSEDNKKVFETHCAPRKNVTIQRKLFYEKKQSTGETIDEWITQLRLIATDCEFHNQDEMIRDMIVLNSVNKKVQERLLETDDLDLSKALKIAKIHETNIEQMKLISNTDVHYVGSRREQKPATRQRYTAPPVRRTDGA